MNKKYLPIILIILLIIIGCIIFIYPPEYKERYIAPIKVEKPVKKKNNLTQKLHLTKDQVFKIKKLKQKTKAELKPLLIELKKQKLTYKQLKNNKAKQYVLAKQKNKIIAILLKIEAIQKQHLVMFEKMLNKNQKDKFEKIKEKAVTNPNSKANNVKRTI